MATPEETPIPLNQYDQRMPMYWDSETEEWAVYDKTTIAMLVDILSQLDISQSELRDDLRGNQSNTLTDITNVTDSILTEINNIKTDIQAIKDAVVEEEE